VPNINTKRTKNPHHQVLKKFSDRTETIKAFYENSTTFREICADYAEMTAWLENYCQTEKRSSANCDYALELLKDLEAEIIDCLDRNIKLVNNECRRSTVKWA